MHADAGKGAHRLSSRPAPEHRTALRSATRSPRSRLCARRAAHGGETRARRRDATMDYAQSALLPRPSARSFVSGPISPSFKNSLTRLHRSISPPLDARRSTAGRARPERARSIATRVATYAGCACVRASVGPSLLHTPPQPVALAAAQSPDSCPPSRARRRRHVRARCGPSRGIVWRTRAHAPFPLGVVDEPASLSLFVARRLVIRQKSFLRVCGRNPARSAPPSQPAQPARDATPNTRTSTAARPLVGVSSRKARARRSSRSSCSIASSPPAR